MPPITRRAALLALAPSITAFTTSPAIAAEPPSLPGPKLTATPKPGGPVHTVPLVAAVA